VNYSKLSTIDTPKGSGKKSVSHRKASDKQSMKQIKQILQDSSGKHVYRVEPICESASNNEDCAQSFDICDNEGYSHSHMTASQTVCDTPPPLFSVSSASSLLESASSDQYSFLPPSMPATCASLSMASCTSTTLCGPAPLLPSLHSSVTNLSMPYSPIVYAPLSFGATPPHHRTPFWVVFVKGNISRCAGCGQRNLQTTDGSPHEPPADICLQHKEYVLFENPHTGCHQMLSDLRNVYYHAFQRCVKVKVPNFDAQNDLKICTDVKKN